MRVRVIAVAFGIAIGLGPVAGVHSPASGLSRVRHIDPDSLLAEADTLPHPTDPYLASGVSDPIFAYLIGLLDRGIYGTVTETHLDRVLGATSGKSCIPHRLISESRRAAVTPGKRAWTSVTFAERLKVPIPYSILGYNPGSLVASQEVTLEETHFSRMRIPNPAQDGPPVIEISDLRLWALVDGEIVVDIDGWVDALLGGKLDDTYIVGLAIFWLQEKRFAMALGFNSEGVGRSGALDLESDRICFPSPIEIKAIGRCLRARVVRRLAEMGIPAWVPPEERARTTAGGP